MKSVYLVMLLAAAATAAVVSNEVPDVADGDKVADVDVNELLTGVDELADVAERLAQNAVATPRREQSWGNIGIGDALVYNTIHSGAPINGFYRDIFISVPARISAIRAIPVPEGMPQIVNLSIKSGGIGSRSVTFGVGGGVGNSYRVRIEIFGR